MRLNIETCSVLTKPSFSHLQKEGPAILSMQGNIIQT